MIPVIQTGFGKGKNRTQLASYSSFGIPPQAYQEATGENQSYLSSKFLMQVVVWKISEWTLNGTDKNISPSLLAWTLLYELPFLGTVVCYCWNFSFPFIFFL